MTTRKAFIWAKRYLKQNGTTQNTLTFVTQTIWLNMSPASACKVERQLCKHLYCMFPLNVDV